MTRERDRIQENASKYIVKNCRAYNEPWCGDSMDNCINCTDCVIKQIITICKWYKMSKEDMKRSKEHPDIIRGSEYGGDMLAIQILQLFDIEEIRE